MRYIVPELLIIAGGLIALTAIMYALDLGGVI